MHTTGGAEERQVIVAFWQRSDSGIEFYVPLNLGYMDAMAHLTTSRSAEAARAWVERQFGLNPRSRAQVFAATIGSVVAFALNNTEFRTMSDKMPGAWLSPRSLSYPTNMLLERIEQQLA